MEGKEAWTSKHNLIIRNLTRKSFAYMWIIYPVVAKQMKKRPGQAELLLTYPL